jgi:hypothetical protein
MPHVHVHLHDDFEETKHPRGRGGKFARKGAAAAKGGAKRLTQIAISAAGNFSHEDFKILQQNLHAPNSAPRKSLGQKVLSIAKTLPSLLKGHLKEEKEKAVHAAGALRAMATGKRPSPEQFKGLRQFGVSILMSAGSMASHGDPTGTVGHLVAALGQELVHHSILEHTAKFGAGATRFAYAKIKGTKQRGRDAESIDDMKLLQDFITTLAKVAAEKEIPQKRVEELMKKKKQ